MPPTSEEDTETEMWKETKWIVKDANMMDLFKKCKECGSVIKQNIYQKKCFDNIFLKCLTSIKSMLLI